MYTTGRSRLGQLMGKLAMHYNGQKLRKRWRLSDLASTPL